MSAILVLLFNTSIASLFLSLKGNSRVNEKLLT